MQRVCFLLQVKGELIPQYTEAHKAEADRNPTRSVSFPVESMNTL
jgi:hypothetical protein